MRYDQAAGRLVAHDIAGELSRDRKWIAWSDEPGGALFRSRVDGRDRRELAPPRISLLMGPRWSPDGSRLAFAGRERGERYKVYVVSADGRGLRAVAEEAREPASPTWSPDGTSLMFGRPPDHLAEPGAPKAIHIVDVETGRRSTLPGSEGLYSPRWSPDGRFVVAMSLREPKLMLFDGKTERWQVLARQRGHNPLWATDSRSVVFQDIEEDYRPIYRVSLPERRIIRLASSADLARSCSLVSLGMHDDPILRCYAPGADLYALQRRAR